MVSPSLAAAAPDKEHAAESIAVLIALVRAEYDEMPGLVLTLGQASRLFAMDPQTAAIVMETLVAAGVLVRNAAGAFTRRRPRT